MCHLMPIQKSCDSRSLLLPTAHILPSNMPHLSSLNLSTTSVYLHTHSSFLPPPSLLSLPPPSLPPSLPPPSPCV